ncbi:MAG: GAF domain-containing protein [Flavobacteriales bacterium]|nr:GAF domain-containing protein [Flavobacteriales bacterium]
MSDKVSKYAGLVPRIKALIDRKIGLVGNLANISAAIKDEFDFWWVGFYLVAGNELQLGPFQGPVACTRIALGRGVCGAAWEQDRVMLVDNVHEFSNHIACSAETNSEIVLPVHGQDSKIKLVLDIDSTDLATFDAVDVKYLGEIVDEIESLL